ncbi:Delta(14)-sterol reductase [Clonorchis sinensis]|uniref:Delta(14)-sterol reductase n=1 Tax=Clonorchis sinensis TaxID=79923 RepID=A0A8T1M0M9_CLOSI|nr:Delta(14)-sterol reductase [Clonorchis sinensis]
MNVNALWGPAYPFAGVLWPTGWHVYFDYRCYGFVLSYLFLHFLAARLIPFGYRSNGNTEPRRSGYRANGLFALLLFVAIYAVAQFGRFTQLDALRPSVMFPKHWLGLLAATGQIATVAAVATYFTSRRLPRSQCAPEGNTGKFLVDFWIGRPLRPRWFGLDWKIIIYRPGIIGLLLAEATCLCVQWEQYGRVSLALVLLVALHLIWVADFMAFEHTFTTSFEVRHEGFGYYTILGALMIPFVYILGAAYMLPKPDLGNLFTPTGVPIYQHWALNILAVLLFLVGYWICRFSDNQKDLFRRQPNHPSFADTPKISGPHAQRLLAGGWWGFVRHPNYLGTLLMVYAAAMLSGFASPIPWTYPLLLTAALLHRVGRTEYLNAEKYGSSWTVYTKLVPNKLIPRIY